MPSARRYPAVIGAMGRDLVGWRRGRASSVDTYLGLRAAHRATAGWSSTAVRAALAAVPGAVDHAPRSRRRPLDATYQATLDSLRRDGIADLPALLSPEDVASIVAFARTAPARIRRNDGTSTRGTWAERPPDAAAVMLDGAFTWARPEVQRLLSNPRLLALATHATGLRPVVHPPQLYWTAPVASADDDAVRTSLARGFHWDYDGVAGLRLHLYLTDVDDGAGPMQYVAESHRRGALGWHRPTSLDQSGAEAAKRIEPARWRTMTGPAGTCFVSNPHGLHRALRPTERERLFLVLPVQGGGYGGYYRRPRSVPVRDDRFRAALAAGDPELRLFVAAEPGARAAAMAPTADY